MSELAPAASSSTRRRRRLEQVRRQAEQIAMLQTQQRLELAALASEDLAGLSQRYVADELALVLKLSVRQAGNRLEQARCFADFPAVHAKVADGSWLLEHADAVVDELIGSGLDQAQQQQVLDLVLERGRGRTPHELREQVRIATVVLFPEHVLDRAEKATTDRDVRSYVEAPGVASLHAYGPAADIAAMMACLDTMTFPPAPDDPRTVAQRRFDTLRALVCGDAQPGNWQAMLLVSLTTVQGQDELPAELPGFGPIPAAQAREIIAQGASLRRVVVDEHGQLIAVEDRLHRPDLPPEPRPDLPPRSAPRPDPDRPDGFADAPSRDDLAWFDDTTDHTTIYARIDRLVAPAALTACRPRAAAPSNWQWSATALGTALHRIGTDPIRSLNLNTDLSTDRYAVPKRLKRFLELRDRVCVFPGCTRNAMRCDKDHLIPWPRGQTSAINLANECEHHHQGKHTCLTVQRLPDGTFRWTTPCGITADQPPRPVLDAWAYRALPELG